MVQLSWPLLARVVAAAVAALIISPAADSSTIPSYYNNNTSCACQGDNTVDADLIIVGATPGGIMAAVAAARDSNNTAKILILERTQYIGGLPANGLCATDIATFGATGGLFLEFVGRVRKHYVDVYGTHSQQVEDSRDGYHFEPKIAQNVLQGFLDEVAGDGNVEVRMKRQLDVEDKYAVVDGKSLKRIRVLNRDTGKQEWYGSKYFIDATYEGDLIAVAKIPFFIGRESASVYGNELGAGKLYKYWNGPEGPGSTHDGDNAIQAYNYRLSITNSTPNAHKVTMPESYNRTEYLSLIGDIITGCNTAYSARGVCSQTPGDGSKRPNVPEQPNGISRIFSPSKIPNGKLDANNEHLSFISTDLPEENWSYPTATWEWRDTFALRLRSYTLGLIYFAQNDDKVPAWFRNDIKDWGLANDEYEDNGFFPRQVYVREGRRMHGEYIFTSRDALPVGMGMRPPIHNDSVSSSHYALDSHGVRKREEGKINLDGLQSRKETEPYTVPYRVIIPQKTEMSIGNVLAPVPVSGSHIGFSTLRMEPCWMALGQAAGLAVAQLLKDDASGTRTVHDVDIKRLQHSLHEQGAVLVYDSSWAKLSKSEREKKELALLASAGQQITSPVAKSPVTGTSGPGPGLQLQQNLLY